MDITPFVGIVGAVVGGVIGLLGQRMNLGEQRRKDQRERVASFLDATDSLDRALRRLAVAVAEGNEHKREKPLQQIDELFPRVGHHGQYLELVLPSHVHDLVFEAAAVLGQALEEASSGAHDDEAIKVADRVRAILANYGVVRQQLVDHMKPPLDSRDRLGSVIAAIRSSN